MKKNKQTIIIMSLIVLILIVFIAYDKILNNKYKNAGIIVDITQIDNSDWKDISLNDIRFYDTYKTLKYYTYIASRGAGVNDFTDYELADIGFSTVSKEHVFVEEKAESNNDVYGMIKLKKIYYNLENMFNEKVKIDFSKIQSFDGSRASLIFENSTISTWDCGFRIDYYDEVNSKLSVLIDSICNDTENYGVKTNERKIVSAKSNKDKIVVVEKAIYYDEFINSDGSIYYIVYADPQKTIVIDKLNFSTDEIENGEINVDKYLNRASTIIYTFKLNKNNNKYYFLGSIIK